MTNLKQLTDFFATIKHDRRIGITHIGIYAALIQYWQQNNFQIPIHVFSSEIMGIAKISASTTYLRSIRELHEYGYIRYKPSFKRNRGSEVYLIPLNK